MRGGKKIIRMNKIFKKIKEKLKELSFIVLNHIG